MADSESRVFYAVGSLDGQKHFYNPVHEIEHPFEGELGTGYFDTTLFFGQDTAEGVRALWDQQLPYLEMGGRAVPKQSVLKVTVLIERVDDLPGTAG